MAAIGNPNLTTANPVGMNTLVSCAGGNYTDTGTIAIGAKHVAFVNIGGGNVTITCQASISSVNAPQPATWIIPPGLAFNPPITPGSTYPQLEYNALGSEVIIYVEY